MTKQEALDLIKLRLGSRADTDLDALVLAELNSSQIELEGTEPLLWFCLTENAMHDTVAGEARIPVPTDFVTETDEMALEISSDGGVTFPDELTKGSYDAIRAKYGDTTGIPEAYALVGQNFILGPVPDDVYVVRMKYQGRDTAMSSLALSETNEWLTQASDYVVNHAGVAVATWIKDGDAAQAFGARFMAAKTRLTTLATSREEANRDRQMGDD